MITNGESNRARVNVFVMLVCINMVKWRWYLIHHKTRWAINGTNLPYSIQIPYLHILTWCCWSPVFLSVKHISKQSLGSTKTVLRKLRAFFVIFVANSNVNAKRRSLILILFSWGQGTLSPDFCMFPYVLPACHRVRQDSYLGSIASNVAL